MNITKKAPLRALSAVSIALLLLFSHSPLCGCTQSRPPYSSVEFTAMDTYMRIKLYSEDGGEEERTEALSAAKAEILRLDARFSVTGEASDVRALNSGTPLTLPSSDELISLLKLCGEMTELTSGSYDVTVRPLVNIWKDAVPSPQDIRDSMEKVDFSRLSITDNGDGTCTVSANGATLDLGSVVKGYAAQRAADILTERGYLSFIIDLGGNIQTSLQKPDGSSFTVGIADPGSPLEALLVLSAADLAALPELKNESDTLAIVTSGTYQRYFEQDGVRYHHILDANTGYPCNNGLASVTVLTSNGARADALSTALFLLGRERALGYYEQVGGFEAIFITDSGDVTSTPGISELIGEALNSTPNIH